MAFEAAAPMEATLAERALQLTTGRSYCAGARGGSEDGYALDGFGLVMLAGKPFGAPDLAESPVCLLDAIDWLCTWCDPIAGEARPGDVLLTRLSEAHHESVRGDAHVAIFTDTSDLNAQIAHAYPGRAPCLSFAGPWVRWMVGIYRPRSAAPAVALKVAA